MDWRIGDGLDGLVQNWRWIDGLVEDWHWIDGLVIDWWIGGGLADWYRIGDGLTDWSWSWSPVSTVSFTEDWRYIGV